MANNMMPLFGMNSGAPQQQPTATPQSIAGNVVAQSQAPAAFQVTPNAMGMQGQPMPQDQGQPQLQPGQTPMLPMGGQMPQQQGLQLKPQGGMGQGMPTPAGMKPPMLGNAPQGLPQAPGAAQAQPATQAPAQNNLPQDKLTTALNAALTNPASNPFIKALKGAGIDMDAALDQNQQKQDAIGGRSIDANYVQQQGQANAVKTGFNGGSYMDIASSLIGKSEGADHSVISAFVKKNMGTSIDPRQTPWCAAYVNSVLQAGGMQGSNSLAARSLLNIGTPVKNSDVTKGDVVVFGRGGKNSGLGHTGFVDHVSADGKTVFVLGGNQGPNGSVSISQRPISTALGFRRPTAEDVQAHVQTAQASANGNIPGYNNDVSTQSKVVRVPYSPAGPAGIPVAQSSSPAPAGNAYNRGVPIRNLGPDDINTLMNSGKSNPSMAPLINPDQIG